MLSLWARGQNIPATAGLVQVQVLLCNVTTLIQNRAITFPDGTYGFVARSLNFVAPGPYNKVVIRLI